MAEIMRTELRLALKVSEVDGVVKTKAKAYRNVKPEAAAEALVAVVGSLSPLFSKEVVGASRIDETKLI